MPAAFPPTVAEREAELIALQSAFDEYIASSRELEEELDGELAKMQEKLAESTAANGVLSAQLENIAPQLASLESALADTRRKLKEEQKRTRQAEQNEEQANQRVREMEMALQTVREECDVVHEELAFKENELEETRLELEVEKQQLQNELNTTRQLLNEAETKMANDVPSPANDSSKQPDPASEQDAKEAAALAAAEDAYVKKLEEELELVTEQLIETEKRLNEVETSVQEKENELHTLKQQTSTQSKRSDDDDELIRTLRQENADLTDRETKIKEELALLQEEFNLTKEEVALQQEELVAAEEDLKAVNLKLDEERTKNRDTVNKLQIQLKENDISHKSAVGEAALVAATIEKTEKENSKLKEEITALESALSNAKKDYSSVLEELDAVNVRFDEVRASALEEGRNAARTELRNTMKADTQHEIDNMKAQLEKLVEENKALQAKIDETEMALATARDKASSESTSMTSNGCATTASGGGLSDKDSEVVQQLESQLSRAKAELSKKDTEMAALSQQMETRLAKAEEITTKLETELKGAKAKLAESEAHLIVLRREKENSSKEKSKGLASSTSTSQASKSAVTRGNKASIDREELSSMESNPNARGRSSSKGHPPRKPRSRSSSPSSVVRNEIRLQEEAKKLSESKKHYDQLQEQKRIGEVRIKRLEDDLRILQKELFTQGGASSKNAVVTATQMSRLSALGTKESGEMDVMTKDEAAIVTGAGPNSHRQRLEDIILAKDFDKMTTELRALDKKCNNQRIYNAQLLSKMLHLQGNIQVFCRVRPMSYSEVQSGGNNVVEALSETEIGCFDNRSNKWKSFTYDRVWGPDQSQQSVFQDVEPLALSVVDGYNACIFAYGQTGSGKTFTMEGVADNNQYGISYRTIQKIFHLLNLRAQQQRAAEMFVEESVSEDDPPPSGADTAATSGTTETKEVTFTFKILIGMLEIYNEEIYDLLGTEGSSMAEKQEGARKAGGKASLDIRRNKDGRIEVPGLSKERVDTIEDVMQLLKRGNSNRATAATDMNEHSSRSHMVLTVDVISGLEEAQQNKGTLYLVDLAGSERVRKSNVEGEQLKEAGFINKSLSALGNVMEALDRKASHVPYRDSKLTYMLQDSLGGNSRTMMVVTICPVDLSYDESVHALQFATRVRRIQIGAAQRNVTSKNLEETVKSLTAEMKNLTKAKERTENQLHILKRDNTRVQEKLSNLSKAKQQNRTEHKTLEVLKKNNDDMAARWQKEKTAREEATTELETTKKDLRTQQQQVSKLKSKIGVLEQKIENVEHELTLSKKQLQKELNDKSAATVRARREQVFSTRGSSNTSTAASSGARPTTTRGTRASAGESDSTSKATPATKPAAAAATASATEEADVAANGTVGNGEDVRSKVLALLEKHDKSKVSRIDIIMEKFKGKEELLLEKMTQRYESEGGGSPSAGGGGGGGSGFGTSIQKRNEMALQRHQERMKRIREKKAQGGASPAGGT